MRKELELGTIPLAGLLERLRARGIQHRSSFRPSPSRARDLAPLDVGDRNAVGDSW